MGHPGPQYKYVGTILVMVVGTQAYRQQKTLRSMVVLPYLAVIWPITRLKVLHRVLMFEMVDSKLLCANTALYQHRQRTYGLLPWSGT